MVLRKSEYRNNFRWFSPDKRNALWLENALYRAERRQREYVHEPLGDEQDSGYELGDSESEECGLPPTKLRQRRLQLIAEASSAAKKRAEEDALLARQRKSAPPRRSPVEEVDAALILGFQAGRLCPRDLRLQRSSRRLVRPPRSPDAV
ncbi:uncharacterized protein LOC119167519 isoform X5 [Rhipicephalus microplus]|uniref:uncharacterized protein LOC119167519 isoform X5 n=1 Tax=Rhipicephalus microplus TaxID=6941 RepID=UPI003F6C6929